MSTRILLALAAVALPALAQQASSASLTIHADQPGPQVNRQLFGQFAEHLGAGIYGGIWVGEDSKIPNTRGYRNDVLQALRDLKVPVVRWPGGCFADEYNWREGVGPRSKRPVKINTHWGGVTEQNTFGTHEFMDFAEMIGAEAYISGNVGSASPRELAEWVEYVTSPAGSLASERAANGREDPEIGLRSIRRGLSLDGSHDAGRRRALRLHRPALLHHHAQLAAERLCDRVRRGRIRQNAGDHHPHRRHHYQAFRHHGQVRSPQARLAGPGRVGHLVGR